MGQYGRTLFATTWYHALSPELRGTINDASNPGHFNWHIYTRMNWGEPWYAGFRESANAGFTLAASLASTAQLAADPASADAARQFGATPAILELVRQWETARMGRAFPEPVKALLRDNTREFHLEPVRTGEWNLFEVQVAHFTHNAAKADATESEYRNQNAEQAAHWILRSNGKAAVQAVALEFNGRPVVQLTDQPLPPGWSLRYHGAAEAVLSDGAWREQAHVPVAAAAARLGLGVQHVPIRSARQDDAGLKLELRSLGAAQPVAIAPAGGPR
jgi:hypothetical protein